MSASIIAFPLHRVFAHPVEPLAVAAQVVIIPTMAARRWYSRWADALDSVHVEAQLPQDGEEAE